ncbi:MAG: primosomal protein N' [Proteobacteria bacterium]|nr:primosomal protein N' [Pseudomonadota bacterium]
MKKSKTVLQIALPTPLRNDCLDYLVPENWEYQLAKIGSRVRIPFRNKEMVGILLGISDQSAVSEEKLKPAIGLIDHEILLPTTLLKLCEFASQYYQHPLGDVIGTALPSLLRKGAPARFREEKFWKLCGHTKTIESSSFSRSPKQQQLFDLLLAHKEGCSEKILKQQKISSAAIKSLQEKGTIEFFLREENPIHEPRTCQPALNLNSEQQNAVEKLSADLEKFHVSLLDGITGSGKTEVYLHVIQHVLNAGKTCLILVPEIGLTPQFMNRIFCRFDCPISVLHSGLNDRERLDAWLLASRGIAKIIISTRSGIFTPIPQLGLIIVDEEHDASFKQQDGLRYSARDLAIVRAQIENMPIILGSATPSLESLRNADAARYQWIKLTARAGEAKMPQIRLLDLRNQKLHHGLSEKLLESISQHISNGNQVILFINRRGYAPIWMCAHCGWVADCLHCDAHLTLHLSQGYLQCHHCGIMRRIDHQCRSCQGKKLIPLGTGTERLEEILAARFPDTEIIRIDRDTTSRKGALNSTLNKIKNGSQQILIGTQMLAKGHDFPNVTLVGILDADSGLFNADFRGSERLGQLITQVAGRAGRAEKPGEVVVQTYNPQHPLLLKLIQEGFHKFTDTILEERKAASLPPYAHLALFRAEAPEKEIAEVFLDQLKTQIQTLEMTGVYLLGPIPAPMEKRARFYRYQLLLQSHQRKNLQDLLDRIIPLVRSNKSSPRLRWSIDVDPIDLF